MSHMLGAPACPGRPHMKMMLPLSILTMAGRNSRSTQIWPSRFTWRGQVSHYDGDTGLTLMVAWISSSVCCRNCLVIMMPALFTRMLTSPTSARTLAAISRTASRWLTSHS